MYDSRKNFTLQANRDEIEKANYFTHDYEAISQNSSGGDLTKNQIFLPKLSPAVMTRVESVDLKPNNLDMNISSEEPSQNNNMLKDKSIMRIEAAPLISTDSNFDQSSI